MANLGEFGFTRQVIKTKRRVELTEHGEFGVTRQVIQTMQGRADVNWSKRRLELTEHGKFGRILDH